MSLSARIALGPSRRVGWAEVVVPLAGAIVATSTAVARWPAATWPIVAFATIAIAAFAFVGARRMRRARRYSIAVSDRTGIELSDAGCNASEAPWRLLESTVVWPGFAMLALSQTATARSLRLPVFDSDLTAIDRRALSRFLLWSLRGGGTRQDRGAPPVGS